MPVSSARPTSPRPSAHAGVYRDYLGGIGPESARRILGSLILVLLCAEAFARLVPSRYGRTAISSLHGVRAIMQQALADPGAKIIAVGDSTFAGGGVARDDLIVAGHWRNSLPPGTQLYNLAAPGGDTTTSLLLLDALQRSQVTGVDRVIIEVLPGKFYTDGDMRPTPAGSAAATIEELQRYFPDLRPEWWGLPANRPSFNDGLECRAQWELGKISRLYQQRDFFRTNLTGNYPIYWFIGEVMPRSLLARLFPSKAQGNNRLAARLDDFPYDPASVPASTGHTVRFTSHTQGDYLEKCLALARQISAHPPVILAFPTHYDYNHPDAAELDTELTALAAFKTYLDSVAQRTGSRLIFVPSEPFQNPRWWTRSYDHFNVEGSARIWAAIESQARALTSPEVPIFPR